MHRDKNVPPIWLRIALLLGMMGLPVSAQLPVARLTSLSPPGAQIGSITEVTVSGSDLDELTRLQFSDERILTRAPGAGDPPTRFLVTVPKEVPPGIYEARVIGRFGISNPRAFAIGTLPESREPGDNRSLSKPAVIPFGSIVNGTGDATAIDFFQFTATAGQRVLIECQTRAIDSRMDAVLTLSDSKGRELDRNRRGGLIDFTVPADGAYVLKVHDQLFRGGADYFYRLAVSTRPWIDFVFPPAAAPGTTARFTVYGRNLPGGVAADGLSIAGKPLEKISVDVAVPGAEHQQALSIRQSIRPFAAGLDGFVHQLNLPQGVSDPWLIGFARDPVILESNENDRPESAQPVSLPCELAGQFFPRGDQDWISFEAVKGEVYWIEVTSQRLGLPTDPFVLVQRVTRNDKGEEQAADNQEVYDFDTNAGGPEFNTSTRDPLWRFEVKESGRHRVMIRDLFNRSENNPALVYRLAIRRATPDFRLVALPQTPPPIEKDKKEALLWTVLARRGETIPIKVLALRRDGFAGEIALQMEGLPAGLQALPARIPAGQNSAWIMLQAGEEAPSWVGRARLIGKASVNGRELIREARAASVLWAVPDYNTEAIPSRLTHTFALSATAVEAAALSLGAPGDGGKPLETSLAAKLQIPVRIIRRGEAVAGFKIKPAGLPALDPAKEVDVDAKATNAIVELDLTQIKLPIGLHRFHLQTQTRVQYRNNPEAAQRAEEAAKVAEQDAADLAAELKKATDAAVAAEKKLSEVVALAKAADEKAAAATRASTASSADPALTTARVAAEKEAGERAEELKRAMEAKVAAEKTSAEIAAKSAEAEKRKTAAQAVAKEAVEKAKVREVTTTFYSPPIEVRIRPAPIHLTLPPLDHPLSPGTTVELPFTVERLFGFAEEVVLRFNPPKELSELKAEPVTLAKDHVKAAFLVRAPATLPAGQHKISIQATLKFNGQELKLEEPFALAIAPKPSS